MSVLDPGHIGCGTVTVPEPVDGAAEAVEAGVGAAGALEQVELDVWLQVIGNHRATAAGARILDELSADRVRFDQPFGLVGTVVEPVGRAVMGIDNAAVRVRDSAQAVVTIEDTTAVAVRVGVLHRRRRSTHHAAVRLLTLGDLAENAVGVDDLILDIGRVVRIVGLVAVRSDLGDPSQRVIAPGDGADRAVGRAAERGDFLGLGPAEVVVGEGDDRAPLVGAGGHAAVDVPSHFHLIAAT